MEGWVEEAREGVKKKKKRRARETSNRDENSLRREGN